MNDESEFEMLYLVDEVLNSKMMNYWKSLYNKEQQWTKKNKGNLPI